MDGGGACLQSEGNNGESSSVGGNEAEVGEAPGPGGNSHEAIRKSVKSLASESIVVHRQVTTSIRSMSTCRHERLNPDDKIFNNFMTSFGQDFKVAAL